MGKWIWLLAVAFLAGGCAAGTKPCMIIPAQIELATDVREAARERMEQARANASRVRMTLEQSQARLARLIEERDELKRDAGDGTVEEARP